LFRDGERVFLGGYFPGVAGIPSQIVASFDGQKWSGYGDSRNGLSGYANVVTSGGPGQNVYILGPITHAGDTVATSGIFRYANGWSAVGKPLPTDVACSLLAVDRAGVVFVGCDGTGTGQSPVVLGQDGNDWVRLGSLDAVGVLQDIRFDPSGRLWIAGGVRAGDASGSGFVARWDGDHWAIVENGFDSIVFRMAFEPTSAGGRRMAVGGAFQHIQSGSYSRVAAWQNGSWEPLGTGFGSAVLGLAWGEEAIYASTEPAAEGAQVVLGKWDSGRWLELATPSNGVPPPVPGTTYWIRDIVAIGKNAVGVGSLWPQTGGRNVFLYDGKRIQPLGGGLDAIYVGSVAKAGDGLWFGGQIAEAGNGESRVPSVGVAHWFVDNGRLPPRARRLATHADR
jgi:hypothetical protein